MITNLQAQLGELGLEGRLQEVLEEIARVREELGYAIMVTPFSQLVGAQAVLNVVTGERYGTTPNEVVKYAFGHYGELAAPIDPEVMDRIARAPAARGLGKPEPPPPVVDTLRARFGGAVSDDELLLRIMCPDEHVAAMLAAGPITPRPPSARAPVVELIRELGARRQLAYVRLEKDGLALTMRMGEMGHA
jgi:oxaloacetate decarboxylase alpha subunit